MNEKSLGVLEQYDLDIKGTYRTKGNYGCYTAEERYILQEYNNSNEKMEVMKILYDYLQTKGLETDYVIANREGNFVSVSEDGYTYILKRWFPAEECDVTNISHICLGAEQLGRFHKYCENTEKLWKDTRGFHPGEHMLKSFERHNKEIIRIKNYIKKRKNKNYFEMSLQKIIDNYEVQGEEAFAVLAESEYEDEYNRAIEHKTLNHGSYNHHNVMFLEESPILVNMMRISYAPAIQDVYDYMRKVMEKNNWSYEIGSKVMEAYDRQRPVSSAEYRLLKIMLMYPEKFWKIINYYYNSNKAWYSEKNEDKLRQFQKQEKERWSFINKL